jgi:hypothetical protein
LYKAEPGTLARVAAGRAATFGRVPEVTGIDEPNPARIFDVHQGKRFDGRA